MLSTLRTSSRGALSKTAGRSAMPAVMRFQSTSDGSMKSWVPTKGEKVHEAVQASMIYSLSKTSLDIAENIVPWYLSKLPATYFREVGESTRMDHLKGLAALKGIGHGQDVALTLRSKDEENGDADVLTILRTDTRPGAMYQMLGNVQANISSDSIQSVRSYTAFDNTLTVNVFTFGHGSHRTSMEDGQAHVQHARSEEERAAVAKYLECCHPSYAKNCSAERFERHRKLYEQVKGTERSVCDVFSHQSENVHEITLVAATSMPEDVLTKVTGLLPKKGMNIVRLQLDVISDPENPVGDRPGSVALIRILVDPANGDIKFPGDFNDVNGAEWNALKHELCRLNWLDNQTIQLGLNDCPDLGMGRAEILTGLIGMLHGPLSKINPLTYSRPNLYALITNPFYTNFFAEIADLMLNRFNPSNPLSDDAFASQCGALRQRLDGLTNEAARTALFKMVEAVEKTVKTNFYMPSRYALAFRIDPSLMVKEGQAVPFGALFVHGKGFDGFHNRFLNIARGGLRLVSPTSAEQYSMESSRCYDEVYGLSFAQQLKNKDIPEGGSKAVCLVNLADVDPSKKHNALRTSVKGFTDAVLDLIVKTPETEQYMVDKLGFDELIYLGPDEQVIPEDIDWIIQQAGRRGYPIPAAFMSSKPLAGINHKEYGVTSEGVAVFLDVALRNNGINPDKEEFSVKVTGGPDGDVAGNLMRILFRDYGDNVKIVGVADGSGCAEDPAGLNHAELMRLFELALPIGDLNQSTLSSQGVMHLANSEEGIRMRNNMHNRVMADVFVPGGGRPSTIHADNWENFFDASTGMPSSPLIVEGANIFITPEARKGLFEKAGVVIVKDSSANKCGVITSSYEICASMLLSESEFLEIKKELVEDVLVRLRELARFEAELMFREYDNYPGALPEFSERISQAINRAKEAVRGELATMQRGDALYNELKPLFLYEHLPKKLAAVAADRVDERIPLDYMRNAFASSLASKLLYKEGTHFLESQPTKRLAQVALEYTRKEKRVEHLISSVASANMRQDERDEVLRLLKIGGTRSSLLDNTTDGLLDTK